MLPESYIIDHSTDIMNFLFTPYVHQVPEWRECYYDHRTLQACNTFLSKTIDTYLKLNAYVSQAGRSARRREVAQNMHQIGVMVGEQSQIMAEYSRQETNVIVMFVQYKVYEIEDKYGKYRELIARLGLGNKKMELLLENLYIEAYYLQHTVQYNISQEAAVIDGFRKNIDRLPEGQDHFITSGSLSRLKQHSKKLLHSIQNQYIAYNPRKRGKTWAHLQHWQQKQERSQFHQPLSLGFIMGALCAFIAIVIMINVTQDIGLDENQYFKDTFPAWRGACEIIFYMWVLGLNILIYEKSQINYKLIFYFDSHNLPHSKFIFILASTFSFICLCFFMLYFLKITDVIQSSFSSYAELFWLILIVYVVQPLPVLQHQGRFYLLKMLGKVILSVFFPMNFLMIWISEQIVSLTQPLTDLYYTFCYFIERNGAACRAATPNINSGIVITVFVFRMFQNLKLWHQISQARPDKVYDFWAPPFLGFCRALFGFITGICALVYRLRLFQNAFVLWIVIIITSTLVAWYVDVRGDWGLLNHQANSMLRQKLLYPDAKYIYYFFMFFDLFLRVGWVLTISPFVIHSEGVWPLLFVMIIAFIEIFRRGVWNFLRVEFEHVKNCGEYQATIKDGHLLKELEEEDKKMRQNGMGRKSSQALQISSDRIRETQEKEQKQLRKLRKAKQLQVFKLKLGQRRESKLQMQQKFNQNKRRLTKIITELQNMQLKSLSMKIIGTILSIKQQQDYQQ